MKYWYGHFRRIFDRKGASPTNQCWCRTTRMIAVSCGIKISAVHHLVLSQSDRQTDGRTDRQTDRIATAIPCVALHAVARQNLSVVLPRTTRVTVNSHFPCSFSSARVYLPASLRTSFAIVNDVIALMVSVLKRFGSGSFPPLNVHVTFG